MSKVVFSLHLKGRISKVRSSRFQFDVASLVPLELFYFKTGINPLLRLPRLLKVKPWHHTPNVSSNNLTARSFPGLYITFTFRNQSFTVSDTKLYKYFPSISADQVLLWVQRASGGHLDQSLHLQVSVTLLVVSWYVSTRVAGKIVTVLSSFPFWNKVLRDIQSYRVTSEQSAVRCAFHVFSCVFRLLGWFVPPPIFFTVCTLMPVSTTRSLTS